MTRTAARGAVGAAVRGFLCKGRMERLLLGSLQPSPHLRVRRSLNLHGLI